MGMEITIRKINMLLELHDMTENDFAIQHACETQPDGSLVVRVSAVHNAGKPILIRCQLDSDELMCIVQ
jgi:hypothetical protein